ncbi:MAG: L7Ae/L30e/S12e/Gadd45 family ribosomal protein [Eubacterium sp.]
MEKNKLLSVLGLARRAGRLAMGRDAALKSIYTSKAKLLIFANDISERSKKEMTLALNKNKINIPVLPLDISIDEIHYSCGYKAGIIAVNDENFSKKIISLTEN